MVAKAERLDALLLFPLASERVLEDDSFAPKTIFEHQQATADLKKEQRLTKGELNQITSKELDGFDIVHLNGKLLIPNSLKKRVLNWYHIILVHPGVKRLFNTLSQNVYWKGMKRDVENYCKTCPICQTCKKPKKEYGNAQPKEAKEIK